jgi:hypothetical protein
LIEISIFYDERAKYALSIEKLLEKFSLLAKKEDVKLIIKDRAEIAKQDEKKILAAIREIKPQLKGKVRASRGGKLPISGSGKLNLGNTPVILVSRDGEQVYVFPCRMGEKEYDISSGLDFLSENLPALPLLKSETEDDILAELENDPTLLEDSLRFKATEVDTSTGKADLLFLDSTGKHLLVEVERDAGDAAVGQILRLCAGYESKVGLASGSVRIGIVCLRMNDNVRAAAKRGGIEVWTRSSKKEIESEPTPLDERGIYRKKT